MLAQRLPPSRLLHALQADPTVKELHQIEFCTRWFVQMRWVAVIAATTLVILTVMVFGWLPHRVLLPLVATIAGLVVFNSVVVARLRRGAIRFLLPVQVYGDLAALNLLLHFSGGIENPLYILALFHVILAGILLSRGECFVVAAVAGVMCSVVAWGEWSHLFDHYTLAIVPHGEHGHYHASHQASYAATVTAVFFGALFLTAYFVTRLSGQIRSDKLKLERVTANAVESHELLERALQTTGTGLRVLDADLRPRWANDRWYEWFDAAAIATASSSELDSVRKTLDDGAMRTEEVALPPAGEASPQAGTRSFRLTIAPIMDEQGAIREVVELATEITEEKEEQARLMRAGQLAAVGELASRVAHEVNNPIAVLSAKGRILLSKFADQVPEKVRQDLQKMVGLADRVAQIAQGLLSHSRPTRGARGPLNLRETITDALDFVRQRSHDSDIAIGSDLAEDLPLVHGNANELGQVFLNLFLNALDAMPDGGRLGVTAGPGPGPGDAPGVTVTVQDTGVGMSPEVRDRIFEPFFTTKEGASGTGLGLSICYGLVRDHGGVIEVDSEPGRGTRFSLWLPAAPTRPDGSPANG